jgi:hypothetical protein
MRRIIAVALLAVLASSVTSAQVAPARATGFTREQLLEDFQVMRQALEEGHSGIARSSDGCL